MASPALPPELQAKPQDDVGQTLYAVILAPLAAGPLSGAAYLATLIYSNLPATLPIGPASANDGIAFVAQLLVLGYLAALCALALPIVILGTWSQEVTALRNPAAWALTGALVGLLIALGRDSLALETSDLAITAIPLVATAAGCMLIGWRIAIGHR